MSVRPVLYAAPDFINQAMGLDPFAPRATPSPRYDTDSKALWACSCGCTPAWLLTLQRPMFGSR